MKTKKIDEFTDHTAKLKSHRAPWLRAAILGANDGIVSTASLMVGVATATYSESAILTAGIAGLTAGALSMAAGEYVSVSGQRDSERADLEIERIALKKFPNDELKELTTIYEQRGLSHSLATQVAEELHKADALDAHARDKLNIDTNELARPLQAAITSAAAFSLGASVPIIAALLWQGDSATWPIVISAMAALGLSGAAGALIGGGNRLWAALRVLLGGGLAMAVTALIGHLLNTHV